MSKSHNITKDGSDWLVVASDPFHDTVRMISGLPDSIIGPSYVRVYNQATTVNASTDGDQVAVIYNGLHGKANAYTLGTSWQFQHDGADAPNIAPVCVITGTAAVDPTYYNVIATTASVAANFDTVANQTIPSRLIGLAIEVRDTSATLYQKGTIVVGSIGGRHRSGMAVVNDSADVKWPIPVQTVPETTGVLSHLTVNPLTVTHECRDGCYVVARMIEPGVPFNDVATQASPIVLRVSAVGGSYYYLSRAATGDVTIDKISTGSHSQPSGFQPFQIWISGLSAESSLRINVRTIVEYFPDYSDTENLGIATHSPSYDPTAMMVYHELMKSLPISVPVGFNAAGDWWRMVAKRLKQAGSIALKLAPGVLSAVGQPELAAVATALNSVRSSGLVKPIPSTKTIKRKMGKKATKRR